MSDQKDIDSAAADIHDEFQTAAGGRLFGVDMVLVEQTYQRVREHYSELQLLMSRVDRQFAMLNDSVAAYDNALTRLDSNMVRHQHQRRRNFQFDTPPGMNASDDEQYNSDVSLDSFYQPTPELDIPADVDSDDAKSDFVPLPPTPGPFINVRIAPFRTIPASRNTADDDSMIASEELDELDRAFDGYESSESITF